MRTLKKCAAIVLAAAMVITAAPTGSADAAKKPKLKKKASVEVGKTVKVKVKNAKKAAKVTWKITKKQQKIAKIKKKVTKGKKASATVLGVSEGTATLKATYKIGSKKTNLKCKITVKKATESTQPTQAATQPTTVPTGVITPPSGDPVATDPGNTDPTATPTVRPTRTPTAVPTASPTPLPDGDYTFDEVTDGVALDISAYESLGGTGGYNSEKQCIEINDTQSGDNSMGTWSLADFPAISTGDEVTFRIQGYNYGDSGFRFWIGGAQSGGCTPVMLVDEVEEGMGILSEYGYPCVLDEEGNVIENSAGESLQGMTANNQMAINVDPETKAFDITFTLKAGTSQDDTSGAFTNLTLKYIMSGGTSGYINGLVIKNVYYIDEELASNTPEPKPTVDPSIEGIDISGTRPLYGTGSVAVNDDGSVTGTTVDGLLIPLGTTVAAGESVNITVYGEATAGARMWLSDSENKRWSDIQNPMEFGKTYTLTASDAEGGPGPVDYFQIKGSAYGVSFDSITITKVVVEDPNADPSATDDPSATNEPTATDDPSATNEPTATDDPSATNEPTATDDPTTTDEPTATDDPSATDEPTGYTSLDLSGCVVAEGNGSYNNDTGNIEINDSGDSVVYFDLPSQVENGQTVTINVKGTWSGTTGFRFWIGNGPNSKSDVKVFDSLEVGEFDETFNLTATDACTMLTIKNIPSWSSGGPIDGLSISSISVKMPTATDEPAEPTAEPKQLDLSTITITDSSTMEVNEDNSATITCQGQYTGGISIAIPAEYAEGAKKISVVLDAYKDDVNSGGGQIILQYDNNGETSDVTTYNWGASTYDDTVFNIDSTKGVPTKIIINNQEEGTVFEIQKIEITY